MSSCLPDSAKHVDPLADAFNGTLPKIPYRVWKAGGDFLDMLNEGYLHAQQAAQQINDLAAKHGLAVIYNRNRGNYRFTLREPTDPVPEGWKKVDIYDGEFFLEHTEIDNQLEELSTQVNAFKKAQDYVSWILRSEFHDEMKRKLEDNEALRTFPERMDTTLDTLQFMIIDDSIYLLTAADGLDIPDCEEVPYADFLIAQANFHKTRAQEGQRRDL
ncbi:MAG: hypothetical protein KDJ50_06010 [Alphaproteobacteria bacterium]|nr:hypothetical protein [Alphaproteobacteria bacterium]